MNFIDKLENAIKAVFEQEHSGQILTQGTLIYLAATIVTLPFIALSIVFPPTLAVAIALFLVLTASLNGLRVRMMADVLNVSSPYAGKLPQLNGISDLWVKGIGLLAVAGFYGLIVALLSSVVLWPSDFIIDHIKVNDSNIIVAIATAVAITVLSLGAILVKAFFGTITEFAVLNYAGSNKFWRSLINVPQAISPILRNPLAVLTAIAIDLLISVVQCFLALCYLGAILVCLFPLFWLIEAVLVLLALPLLLAMNFAGDLLHSHIWAQTFLECAPRSEAASEPTAPSV